MNLTYDDQGYVDSVESQSNAHQRFKRMHAIAAQAGVTQTAQGTQLSGFFSNLVNFVKTTNSGPIKAVAALATGGPSAAEAQFKSDQGQLKNEFASGASVAVPVISAFFPIVGGVLKVADVKLQSDLNAQKALQTALGNDQALVSQYTKVKGQIAGRNIGPALLQQIMGAQVRIGGWPPLKVDNTTTSPASSGTWANAQKAAAAGISRTGDAKSIFDNEFTSLVKTEGPYNLWVLGQDPRGGPNFVTAGSDQQQVLIDFIDAALAALNPNIPYSYGTSQSDTAPSSVPVSAATPPTMPTPQSVPTQPVLTAIATPTVAPASSAAPLTSVGLDPNTQAQISAMLSQMQNQGASQQQMYSALLQQLANQGVNTQAPQVQQAAIAAVQPQTNYTPYLLAGGALLALYLIMGKRK